MVPRRHLSRRAAVAEVPQYRDRIAVGVARHAGERYEFAGHDRHIPCRRRNDAVRRLVAGGLDRNRPGVRGGVAEPLVVGGREGDGERPWIDVGVVPRRHFSRRATIAEVPQHGDRIAVGVVGRAGKEHRLSRCNILVAVRRRDHSHRRSIVVAVVDLNRFSHSDLAADLAARELRRVDVDVQLATPKSL